MRLCWRPACPRAQQQLELSLGPRPLSCSCPASGPRLLGGRHLGHRAEALVAGGGRAGLVGHDGVPVCGRDVRPRGRGAQAQLLCFDGARAQRVQALWQGPAWQRQSGFRPASGPSLATVNALCVLHSWAGEPLPTAARSTGALACPQGVLLAGWPLIFPSSSTHNASIPQETTWSCGGERSRVHKGAVPQLPIDAPAPGVDLPGVVHRDGVAPAAGQQPHWRLAQAAHLHRLGGVRRAAHAQLPKLHACTLALSPLGLSLHVSICVPKATS